MHEVTFGKGQQYVVEAGANWVCCLQSSTSSVVNKIIRFAAIQVKDFPSRNTGSKFSFQVLSITINIPSLNLPCMSVIVLL